MVSCSVTSVLQVQRPTHSSKIPSTALTRSYIVTCLNSLTSVFKRWLQDNERVMGKSPYEKITSHWKNSLPGFQMLSCPQGLSSTLGSNLRSKPWAAIVRVPVYSNDWLDLSSTEHWDKRLILQTTHWKACWCPVSKADTERAWERLRTY